MWPSFFCCQELWTSCFVKGGPSFFGEGEGGPVTLCVKRAGCPCFVCAGERGPDFVKGRTLPLCVDVKRKVTLSFPVEGMCPILWINDGTVMDQ